jgi:hypothetical protein
MAYENRLLLLVDILGWSDAIMANKVEDLLPAVERIHRQAEVNNERFRQELLERDGKRVEFAPGLVGTAEISPMFLQVQFGAFSDHFVYSLPESFGGRILTVASKMIIDLLRMGFLTRGAIVHGGLFHRDNIVFGRALLDAVEAEKSEAFYPRILVSDAAAEWCTDHLRDSRYQPMIRDQTGRLVVNPFAIPAHGSDEMMDSLISLNYFPAEIRALVDSRIRELDAKGRHRHSEKWRYMRDFISGPVLRAVPAMKRHWIAS